MVTANVNSSHGVHACVQYLVLRSSLSLRSALVFSRPFTRSSFPHLKYTCACSRTCMCAGVQACRCADIRPCVRACGRAGVRAGVHARLRAGGRAGLRAGVQAGVCWRMWACVCMWACVFMCWCVRARARVRVYMVRTRVCTIPADIRMLRSIVLVGF